MPTERKPPDWMLERLALGELEPEQVQAPSDEETRERLAALQVSNEQILAAHPPAAMVPAITRRLDGARPERRRTLFWAPPALVAAAAVVFLLVRGQTGAGNDGVRIKGAEPHLLVFREAGADSQELSEGAQVQAGDVLQLAYVAAGQTHGVVVSVDGRGGVTLHYPGEADESTLLVQAGPAVVPHAYALDDAPGFERFVFVTSNRALSVKEVLAAARRVASGPEPTRTALGLPETAEDSFLVRKAGP